MLLSHMSVEELREEACDCLFEIVNKGMDPVDKTKLVESLSQVLQNAGFFNVKQVRSFHCALFNRDSIIMMWFVYIVSVSHCLIKEEKNSWECRCESDL